MLPSILVGVTLVAATVVIHAVGNVGWIEIVRRRGWPADGGVGIRRGLALLVSTAATLVLLHVAEVVLWAAAYRLLDVAGLPSIEDALYFSFVTFTTVGYGDLTVGGSWRLLAGIEAMNGILLFGWSAAVLFALVQRIWQAGREPVVR